MPALDLEQVQPQPDPQPSPRCSDSPYDFFYDGSGYEGAGKARSRICQVIFYGSQIWDFLLLGTFGPFLFSNLNDCNKDIMNAGFYFIGYWTFFIVRNIVVQIFLCICRTTNEQLHAMHHVFRLSYMIIDCFGLGYGIYYAHKSIESENDKTGSKCNKSSSFRK